MSEKKQVALWQMGFRPFFLAGALEGLVLVVYWSGWLYQGWALGGQGNFVLFHAHEMLHGFVMAIVAGFLLTASANWTGTRGLHGRPLQILVGVWFVGRVGMAVAFFAGKLAWVWLSALFLPLLIASLLPPLWKARKWQNLAILGWLGFFWVGGVLYLAEVSMIWGGWGRKGLFLGVYGMVFLMVMIGGRVIPYFTKNALQDPSIGKHLWSDRLALASAALFVLVAFVWDQGLLLGAVALLAGGLNLFRMRTWGVFQTWSFPILWILNLSYLWVIAGFFLLALAALGGIGSPSAAIHAFTLGGMGGLILGMISRVALGHTGRPLRVPFPVVVGYVCIMASAALRVGSAYLPASWLHLLLLLSGLLWVAAYGIYLVAYTPILLSPRFDGRDG